MSEPDPATIGAVSRLRLSWSVEEIDRYRPVTLFALLGVGAAVAMAVFGLPPVDIHGPLHWLGIMDPFCGGTRAARYTAEGNLPMAWKYNPLGILVVAGGALTVARAIVGAATGRWVTPAVQWTTWGRRTVVGVAVVLLVGLAIRQQLIAPLLLARQ